MLNYVCELNNLLSNCIESMSSHYSHANKMYIYHWHATPLFLSHHITSRSECAHTRRCHRTGCGLATGGLTLDEVHGVAAQAVGNMIGG
mmetsp:Transcript_33403/g.62284  ORF Transcript_33403/g.62284 Transcript_33403/m.62284 type:complete len:89 (+) Transcript_33403:473-739(+)